MNSKNRVGLVLRLALALMLSAALPMTGSRAHAQGRAEATMPDLVASLLPAVVSIATYTFERTVPDPQKPNAVKIVRHKAYGSGFIVEGSGLIATAAHVVEGADRITVTLNDGTALPGRLIYRAPVDIALIKIDPKRPLTVVKFGNSDQMRPGDEVISIGNPLGLGFTVTSGIISALDRDIKQASTDSFLQTDAAVNPGNSGGPLFNRYGDVIGQNNAIYTVAANQGSAGLGFAMPGNEVRFVLEHYLRYGRLRLGWFGANVQAMSPDAAEALGMAQPRGVLVSSVQAGSPAAWAKLRDGDVIVAIDGYRTDSPRWYGRIVGSRAFDAVVEVQYFRDGAIWAVDVPFAEDPSMRNAAPAAASRPSTIDDPMLGLALSAITDDVRARFNIPAGAMGVVVTDVMAFSEADDMGVRPGDMVVKYGQTPIASAEDLRKAVAAAMAAKRSHVLVQLSDEKGQRWVATRVPERLPN